MLQTSIIGNLGANAEVKDVNGNKFVSFNVAHTERWKQEDGTINERTMWVSCALNGDGGNLLPYLKKGATVFAIGRASTRVYSSEKARGFVAGINLSVQHIELVGGKADDVPARLYTKDGVQVDVAKYFWVNDCSHYGTSLLDRSGNAYAVDAQGWVTRLQPEQPAQQVEQETTQQVTQKTTQQVTQEAAQDDAPFLPGTTQEERAEAVEKTKKSKSKK